MMNALLLLVSMFGLELSLKPEAAIRGEDIYLSDVLASQSMHLLRQKGIRNLKVAAAPGYNRNRILQRNHVVNAIQNAYPGVELAWSGPGRTSVSRRADRFSQNALEEAIRTWIADHSPATGELRMDRVIVPRISGIPSGKVVFDIRVRGNQSLVGRRSLYVDLIVDDKMYKTLAVQVHTSLETLVARVITEVPRGMPLTENHIEWEVQRLDRLTAPLVTPDDFQGLRARSLLRPGTVLDRRKVQVIPLVERNTMVSVVTRNGGLSIRLKALAMDAGGAGDRIRLKNVDSGRVFTGLIQKSGEVVLEVF